MAAIRLQKGDLMSPDESFAFWVYAIAAIICCITVCVFVYIEINVIKKVGASDKVIPMMLLMLQFSAISKSYIQSIYLA